MISITTWNILADRYSDVYKTIVPSDVLLWSNRIKGIIKKIKELNSDVVCLQEVEIANAAIDFIELFGEYDFVKHEIDKKRDNPIGNMILWKKDKFTSINTIRHSCAVHTLLKYKDESKSDLFWIMSVHLKAGLSSGETMRVSQIKSCLEKFNKWKKSCNKGLGIICGDFNDKLNGLVFNELKLSGFKQTNNKNPTCMLRNGDLFNFDHILVNSEQTITEENEIENNFIKVENKIFLNARSLLTEHLDENIALEIIPNINNPSDHFPVTYIIKTL